MRRITEPADRERGGIAVLVAILMVVLLGFAAISIDVAKLYSERAQLQNGADAAALMVAQKCATNEARGESDPNCSATSPLATDFANMNSLDGRSNVKSIDLDKPNRTVQVTTSAQEAGAAANSVSMFFAGVFGFPSAEVTANSSASWGSPAKGKTPFPITVSICQVHGQAGVMQRLQLHGSKNGNDACNYGPSGATVPGGFGGLKEDGSSCSASIDVTATSAGSPGNDAPKTCEKTLNGWATDMAAGKDVIMLLPIFDGVSGTGDNAVYKLTTIAAFKVQGWKLGPTGLPYTFRNRYPAVPSNLECTEPCRGIIGTFVEYVSLADGFAMGPVNSDGAIKVVLTD